MRLINEPKTYFFRTNIYDSNYCHRIKINKIPAHEVKVFCIKYTALKCECIATGITLFY